MDSPEIRSCVKELDLTIQPRPHPRYITWLPLATQQLRLRNLIQVIGYKLNNNSINETCWFYYTLHRSSMSSPLYTSEPIDSINPKWLSLEVPILHKTGYSTASEVIIRIWKRTVKDDPSSDVNLFTWGISLSGLVYVGTKLPSDLGSIFHDNSLIFQLHGGYFAPPFSFKNTPELKKYLTMKINASEVRDSYTVDKLTYLKNTMQELKKKTDSVQSLREKIASGENLSSLKQQRQHYSQTSLNRLLQPKKPTREKIAEIQQIKKDLEIAKFRAKLLEQERVRKMGEIRALNLSHSELLEKNEDFSSELTYRYQNLNREVEKLNERRCSRIESRDIYIQTTAQLAHRRQQLISELENIYPITSIPFELSEKFFINGVNLPDSEKLDSASDTQVAVALGFVAHCTQMVANFFNVPTRYPILHYGSRSKIVDHINDDLPDFQRQFPLFARSKDKLQFNYAVYLLNKNIAQLRWYCGLPTSNLPATLPNLLGLINVKPVYNLDSSKRTFSSSLLDIDNIPHSKNILITPPIQKSLLFDSISSFGYFKGPKTILGSSLDQGLNQPAISSDYLSIHSKRICKSEENAIDDDSLSSVSVRRICNIAGSDETFRENSLFDIEKLAKNFRDEKPFGLVENNIEVMVPTSVTKLKMTPPETPVSSRQRSSTSISSCEMALSSSAMEPEDFENSANVDKIVQKNNKDTDSVKTLFLEQQSDLLCDRGDKESPNIPLIPQEAVESLVSNDIIAAETKQSEAYMPSRQHQKSVQDSPDGAADCSAALVTHILDKTACDQKSKSKDNKEERTACSVDFLSSTEYNFESIKRSSENVFARTEALANKTTSFKVMRPRM